MEDQNRVKSVANTMICMKRNSPLWIKEAPQPSHSTKKGYPPISASSPPTIRELFGVCVADLILPVSA